MRGNPARAAAPPRSHRSIPARAGEPRRPPSRTARPPVYPRACGGTDRAQGSPWQRNGLSPRVRGNRQAYRHRNTRIRSIPVRAGEPLRCRSRPVRRGVYPRACGGTLPVRVEGRGVVGLSPRVRGNRLNMRVGWPMPGSIPARAGEPERAALPLVGKGVYPRACGGTDAPDAQVSAYAGLSPRVRGNPVVGGARRLLYGSIPARAGEPTTGD